MNQQNELTGIERQLVLQYLMDGNVPVTVTEEIDKTKEPENDKKNVKSAVSGVFPVALLADQMTVLDQGIILLQNPPESVKPFDGKMVRVQFYFNKLGLYFVTQMKSVKSGLALAVPGSIKKVEDVQVKNKGSFTAIVNGVKCGFLDSYPPFAVPKWSDVAEENQVKAKNYLEHFVMESRSNGKTIGNGLHLITVCRYLSEEQQENKSSIEDRQIPPNLIYIDEQRIVFATEKNAVDFKPGCEYSLVLGFPIPNGPIRERTVLGLFTVDNIFNDDENCKNCVVCRFTQIKEEDARYLEDKKA